MKSALTTVLLICLLATLVMLAYSLTRKDRLRSIYFTLLCSVVGMYDFGYLLEVFSSTREAAVIANKVQNVGIPLIAPLFLLFLLNICQYDFLRRWMVTAALSYGGVMFLCILFNETHLRYYPTMEFLPVADMHYLLLGHGPLYYAQQTVTGVCILAAYMALLVRMRRWSARTRRNMSPIVLGSLVPLTFHILYVARVIRVVDPAPISMTLTLVLFSASLMRYRMYDITGIASENAVQSMDDAMVVLDAHWCFQYANESAIHLFEGLRYLVANDSILNLRGWPIPLQNCTGPQRLDFEMQGEDGAKRYYRAHVSAVANGRSKPIGWSVVIRDVTEMAELLEKMQRLAVTDPLTGISNRRHFMENVQRQLNLARREHTVSSMLIFDIDHFKQVNDTYGHQAGDVVLIIVAETIIKRELRSYDYFARYGGEEFALFILNIQGENAESFAWRLCHAIADMRIPHQGTAIEITASFGLVEVPWDTTLEDAIQAADTAMYQAKQRGRNCVECGQIPVPVETVKEVWHDSGF